MVHGTYDIKIRYLKKTFANFTVRTKILLARYSPTIQGALHMNFKFLRTTLLAVTLHAARTAHCTYGTNPHILLWATNFTPCEL